MAVVRAANEYVGLALWEPEPGSARVLTGELTFPPTSPARRATVRLALVAQETRGRPVDAGPIAALVELGDAAEVERADEGTRLSMTLPRGLGSFIGPTFSFAIAVVVTPDAGRPLRTVVDVVPADGIEFVLTGLPLERRITARRPGMLGRLRRRGVELRVVDGGAGTAEVSLEVSLEVSGEGRGLGSVCATLRAVEYDVHRSDPDVRGELTATQVALVRRSSAVWSGHLALPPVPRALPSVSLTAPRRTIAVRWFLRIDLTDLAGTRTWTAETPVSVAARTVGRPMP
jgi:hypothetical protein